jgi:ornithine cyclodeaminase/alanine dehydrogenase-like protein (mu-crystallin family)
MTHAQSVPYFSEEALAKLEITTVQLVDLIEQLIRDRAASKVWSPPKAAISLPDDRYAMSTMAVADDPPFLALKSLMLNPRNPSHGEPLMNSVIVLQDSETGRPVALLDGNWVTAFRTAALSVLAARRMAKPNSRVIAFIGCGLQARAHLSAMADIFPLAEVRLLGRGQPNIDALCALSESLGFTSHVASTPEDLMQGADIIVSSVTRLPGSDPFVDAAAIEPDSFAALVDLALPWMPSSLERFDSIIIDDKPQEAVMKKQMVPPELVTGDLTDLVLKHVDPGAVATGRRAFVFRGYALGDFALAALAYQVATATK